MMSGWKQLCVPNGKCLMSIIILEMIRFLCMTHMGAEAASIERVIVDSAPKAEMFDFFHVMPEGNVEVMTEWDLLLTMDQYQALYEKPEKSGRVKRKAAAEISTRWTNCVVYYEIHDSLNFTTDRDVIMKAMDEWQKYTCLTFKESHSKPQRIQFKDGGGCYSKLGMQDKPQPLVLARGCRTKGIIAHEIGHAIGWIHEHMRPERDEYITVNFSAILSFAHKDYFKYNSDEINNYSVPYDYTSLMHYGNAVFPDSIRTRDPKYQDKIGQMEGLSFKDIKLANVMYGCDTMFCSPHHDCGRGFQFHKPYKGKDKCQCWCDSGILSDPLILCSEVKTSLPPPQPSIQPGEMPKKKCMDVRNNCRTLKQWGHCMTKMDIMAKMCSKTCRFCNDADPILRSERVCMDYDKGCPIMAASGACTKPGFRKVMEDLCKGSCGLCEPSSPCDIQKEMMGDEPLLDSSISKSKASKPSYHASTSLMVLLLLFY